MIDEAKKRDYEIRLLSGVEIEFQNIFLRAIKLSEIRDFGYSFFEYLLNMCMAYKSDLDKDDKCDDLFEVLTSNDYIELFMCFIGLFYKYESIEYGEKTKSFYLVNGDKIGIINNKNLDNLLEVTRFCYKLERSKKEKDIFDLIAEEENKIRRAKSGDVDITMSSMISAVSCKHPSINLLNIWDCTIYQLKDMVSRLYQIDGNNNVNFGIYTGNVSPKDIKINEHDWCKTLK